MKYSREMTDEELIKEGWKITKNYIKELNYTHNSEDMPIIQVIYEDGTILEYGRGVVEQPRNIIVPYICQTHRPYREKLNVIKKF